jgi:protein phosphatase
MTEPAPPSDAPTVTPTACPYSIGVAAHPGLLRERQEDAHLVLEGFGFVAVADGMGGHNAGDVASGLAIESLREHFERVATGTSPRGISGLLKRLGGASQPGAALVEAVRAANRRILSAARRDRRQRGMGTTLVAAWLCEDRLHYANVGDSRLYLWREGRLRQLTRDHSLMNEYLDLGLIGPADVATFPHKNVIVRAVGLAPGIAVDVGETRTAPRDRYLLCSDGLTDLVDDVRIGGLIATGDDPGATARALVGLALEAGGIDNVTALVVQIGPPPSVETDPEVKDAPASAVPDDSQSGSADGRRGGQARGRGRPAAGRRRRPRRRPEAVRPEAARGGEGSRDRR